MPDKIQNVTILGAGKLGITLAQLALKAGYNVTIAGSGPSAKISLAVEVLAPSASVATAEEAIRSADLVILALPLGKFRSLPAKAFDGTLTIDAMNYWWEVDGDRNDIIDSGQSSSEVVQDFLSSARVIKAFNHMGYHDLHDETRPKGAPGRKAIAVAGDSNEDVETVSGFVDSLGFDPLYVGELSEGRRLEPGTNVFGADLSLIKLQELLMS